MPPPPPGGAPPPPVDPIAADRAALRDASRVSPLGPIFLAWGLIRQIGFLNIGIFTALVGSRNFQLAGIGGSVALLVAGLARWLRFTYALEPSDDGDQLVTRSGVFGRTRTSVPLDRIQSVSTRQNLLHRLTNLVEVSVQTAGSVGVEIQLTAVRPEIADRIRRLSTATKTSGEPGRHLPEADVGALPPIVDAPILRRTLPEILVVALTRNPLVLLAPIPLGMAFAFELGDTLSRFSDSATDTLARAGDSLLGVLLLVLVVVLLSAAVSIALVTTRLYDLRLFVDGAGLRRLSGLISRTEITASVERVQLVGVRHNPIERRLGIAEVVLPVAGGGASIEIGGATPSSLQLPGTRPAEVERVRDIVLRGHQRSDLASASDAGISPLAARRWTQWLGVVPALFATVGLWFAIGPWSALTLLWVGPLAFAARARQRSWRWSLGAETLRVRYGVVAHVIREMPVYKVQNVVVSQAWFHRRHGLADVEIRTASRVQMRVPLIPVEEARAIRDELLHRAETDPRPFM